MAGDDRGAAVRQLKEIVDRTRPVSLAGQRTLPVLSALEPLLAAGGLQRGTVVNVSGAVGATSLSFAMIAGATRAGSWAACVGVPELNWAAAAEAGVALDRVAVVRTPQRSWPTVVAALVDAFDVVLCGLGHLPTAVESRRLAARARERGSVMVFVGGGTAGVGPDRRSWPGAADLNVSVVSNDWSGLGQDDSGSGHLRHRRVVVEVDGRRGAARARRVELWLPGHGGIALIEGASPAQAPLERASLDSEGTHRSPVASPVVSIREWEERQVG